MWAARVKEFDHPWFRTSENLVNIIDGNIVDTPACEGFIVLIVSGKLPIRACCGTGNFSKFVDSSFNFFTITFTRRKCKNKEPKYEYGKKRNENFPLQSESHDANLARIAGVGLHAGTFLWNG